MNEPETARALAIVHTCMYDAWAAYEDRAVGTQLRGALRRPAKDRSLANKQIAISYAAYRALTDLFPSDVPRFRRVMTDLGYDPADHSIDIETPSGIGNVACAAVLEYRHHDRSNQLGDMAPLPGRVRQYAIGPYGDWSGYTPINAPNTIPRHASMAKPLNPDHWQPLIYTDSAGSMVLQMFAGAQWCYVAPFALVKGDELRSAIEPGPFKFGSLGYERQAADLISISARLTDREKMISEYWSDDPRSEVTALRWELFAQYISGRDNHSLDDDVKMFFVVSNSLLDAGIAAWDAKRTYDSVRPATAISLLYKGKTIRAWGGPGRGSIEMDGAEWTPYQLSTFPTPPSPDFASGRSAFSAAAARALMLFTGSDRFGDSVTLPRGSSRIESGTVPTKAVTLTWTSFNDAVEDAGDSGQFGGIQFAASDAAGRKLGVLAAERVWTKAVQFFDGTYSAPASELDSAPAPLRLP